MLLGLKAKLIQQDRSQRELAKLTNRSENRISQIVLGLVTPTPAERAVIASVLKADEADLFDTEARIEIRSAR